MFFPVCILALEDEGDRAFMEKLYFEHRSLMFRVAYKMLHDVYAVEDAINNAFVSLCRHVEKLRRMACCKQRAYVVTTVGNACRDYLRAGGKYVLGDEPEVFGEIPDRGVDVEGAVLYADLTEALSRAMEQLTERERTALCMKYFEEQDDEAIAGALGIKASSVRTVILRARERLRKIMEKEGAV